MCRAENACIFYISIAQTQQRGGMRKSPRLRAPRGLQLPEGAALRVERGGVDAQLKLESKKNRALGCEFPDAD